MYYKQGGKSHLKNNATMTRNEFLQSVMVFILTCTERLMKKKRTGLDPVQMVVILPIQ